MEKKKALKMAKELIRAGARIKEAKKDSQGKKDPDCTRKGKEAENPPRPGKEAWTEGQSWYGGKTSWASKEEALKGVPRKEQEEYGQRREDCWRCGRGGHKTYECHAFNTHSGTTLPAALWKAAAVAP